LSTASNHGPSSIQSATWYLGVALGLLIAITPFATAQTAPPTQPSVDTIAGNTHLDLPDSPGALLLYSSSSTEAAGNSIDPVSPDQNPAVAPARHAPHLNMTVAPYEIADPMTVHDKVLGGFKDSVSLFSAVGWLAAAGWEQVWNDSPNYGTDAGAFGQRLGAATVRGISEGVFSESFFAPLFHEDPRYYIMGPGHPFFKRLVYAGTRAIITRTDAGHTTPNFSLLAGNAAGAALTVTYYPAKNTTFTEVAQTFGGSLGGSALGFVVDEFIVDALVDLHIKKRQP
jgi:hypothetical protein